MSKSIHIYIILVSTLFLSISVSGYENKNKTFKKETSKVKIKKEVLRKRVEKKSLSSRVLFEKNEGQFQKDIKFLSRSAGYYIQLNSKGLNYLVTNPKCKQFTKPKPEKNKDKQKPCKVTKLEMEIEGINPSTKIFGKDKTTTKTGYFSGNDSTKWIKDLDNFKQVYYKGIYKGIDALFKGTGQNLEFDFIISPNSDPHGIKLKFPDVKKLEFDKSGNLIVEKESIKMIHQKPFAYQIINGKKVEISVKYEKVGKNIIKFKIGNYNKTYELIIDPIVYASYLGTYEGDQINDITVDNNGNIYTASNLRMPDSTGSYTYSQIQVTKFTPDGKNAVYQKIYGGTYDDAPYAIDVDTVGQVYLTGVTFSPDFPLGFPEQENHPITQINSHFTGFFMRLNPDGNLLHSTYLGGNCPDEYGESVVADSDSNAYVVGYTCSPDFNTTNGFQTSKQGTYNAFLTKYDSFGDISYSTFFGGDGAFGTDVHADEQGNAYITGRAGAGIVTTSSTIDNGTPKGFAAKFNTNNSGAQSLIYSTALIKEGSAIATDLVGNSWVALSRLGFSSFESAKVIKIDSTGGLLFESEQLGPQIRDIAVDDNGNVYFAEVVSGDKRRKSIIKGLLSSGSPLGSVEIDATRDDSVFGIALGPETGLIYVGGYTTSLDFPTSSGAFQTTSNSSSIFFGQGFFAKVRLDLEPEEKTPLIFVPGVAGSTLFDADADGNPVNNPDILLDNLWTDGIFDLSGTSLSRLTLNPNTTHPNVVAVDAVREIRPFVGDIYKPLLNELIKNGYEEYKIEGNPKKRHSQCTGEFIDKKPSLFVFAYDWRHSNVDAAEQLKEYVECVKLFYPGKKVNILTHSMGGLITRRYILDNPNSHNIDKLVTTVAPWLGAPKGIDALFTNRFIGEYRIGGGIYLHKNILKDLIPYAKGPHQLLPSAWYFILGGKPFARRPTVFNETEEFSFTETSEKINSVFQSQPYQNANDFHNYQTASQDNWNYDISGIKYYHLYGEQVGDNTLTQTILRPRGTHPLSLENIRFGVESKYGKGDKTVPSLSAKRSINLIAPNTVQKRCSPTSKSDNQSYEHNGITQNPILWNEIVAILNDQTINQPQCVTEFNTTASKFSSNKSYFKNASLDNSIQNTDNDDYVLNIYNIQNIQIEDEFGNSNTSVGYGGNLAVPGVDYKFGSEPNDFLVVPHELNFSSGKKVDIKFVVSDKKIDIELFKGVTRNETTEAVKYLDLELPQGVTAILKFGESGVENLRYDSDGDGVFETEVQPDFSLTGADANDKTEPFINISSIINNGIANISINAIDGETGINQVRYLVIGEESDNLYEEPFEINATQSRLIYVSAEDNAGNRKLLAKWIDASNPITTVTQIPSSNSVGWSKNDISIELKSRDDLGGSGVESLTFSGTGAQTIEEETVLINPELFSLPSSNTSSNFLLKTLNITEEGITNLSFYAKDNAGNIEEIRNYEVKVDKTQPITNSSYQLNNQQATVTLNSTDSLSGIEKIEYSIDGSTIQNYLVPFTVSGSGEHTITFYASDRAGNVESSKILTLTIPVSINPEVSILSPESGSVFPVGTTVNFNGSFTDDQCSSHSATWTFDNILQTGSINEITREVSAEYTFTSAGVYLVTLTVNNSCGGSGTVDTIGNLTAMVVIYDPNGGFVTGGGWIDSPLGAYIPNANLIGKASFGFNSKYKNGASTPTGNTEFHFRVADFKFKSTNYDWLVVAGARAKYKGSGTINGTGNYGFMLTAIDGEINGGGGSDKFRIKIWNKVNGEIVYDNNLGNDENSDPTTILGGGSIKIHK